MFIDHCMDRERSLLLSMDRAALFYYPTNVCMFIDHTAWWTTDYELWTMNYELWTISNNNDNNNKNRT
jgi:hypothetical protein